MLSDHGQLPLEREVRLLRLLADHGLLQLETGPAGAPVISRSSRVVATVDAGCANLYLNRAGVRPGGVVDVGESEALLRRVASLLADLEEDGEPLVEKVVTRAEAGELSGSTTPRPVTSWPSSRPGRRGAPPSRARWWRRPPRTASTATWPTTTGCAASCSPAAPVFDAQRATSRAPSRWERGSAGSSPCLRAERTTALADIFIGSLQALDDAFTPVG